MTMISAKSLQHCVPMIRLLSQLLRPTALCYYLSVILVVAANQSSAADELLTITLRIKDHLFVPADLTVPANTRFRLLIINEDSTAEEFESVSLNREKVIMGNSEGVIFLGPLSPGEYSFFGEFNPRTAQGRLIVNGTDND